MLSRIKEIMDHIKHKLNNSTLITSTSIRPKADSLSKREAANEDAYIREQEHKNMNKIRAEILSKEIEENSNSIEKEIKPIKKNPLDFIVEDW